jgi:hypothetical protein
MLLPASALSSQARFAPEELPCPPSRGRHGGVAARCDKGQGLPKGIGGMVLWEADAFLLRANSCERHPSP